MRSVLELPTTMYTLNFLCAFGFVAVLQVPGTLGEAVDPFAVSTKEMSSLITHLLIFHSNVQ